jgi:penicillin-binding protein 1C
MTDYESPPPPEKPVERFKRILADEGNEDQPLEIRPLIQAPDESTETSDAASDNEQETTSTLLTPPLGQTPSEAMPAVGTFGLPLPRRVSEIDADATRIMPSDYPKRPTRMFTPPNFATRQVARSGRQQIRPSPPPPAPRDAGFNWRKGWGCFKWTFVIFLFSTVLILLCGFSFALYQYYTIAKDLPNVDELRQKISKFETTRILDRDGNVLYEILDPTAGRRTYVSLAKISPYFVAATIATEDKEFYSHPGYDIFAIFRAFWQNYQSGETVSGASTITQQLARNLLFTPEERTNRSYERKMREAVLAAEITRRYTKDEILEIYLNENYYGNLSYGVEAAAETYFHTTSEKLSFAQAAFLAGLPQAPSVYDVHTNRELTMKRLENVLVLMYKASQEQGCIYVSNNPQRICVNAVAAASAVSEIRDYQFPSPNVPIHQPHWVNYIRNMLEQQFDPQTIYRSGFSVYTTLDPTLQDLATRLIQEQIARLADKHVTNGALVAIRPGTGEILAMVGSADFSNETISGQVNMATSPRQPGSSIKPITYLAAFEKGWTPASLIWDVPSEFPPSGNPLDPMPPYKPVNYDGHFHGPVTIRYALANSYNLPAVKTLAFVGVYDNPDTPQEDGFIATAKRLGITTLTRPDYGLSLTLGGGEVTLLELTDVYASLADGGLRVPPLAITRILDHEGNLVYTAEQTTPVRVMRAEHAFLLSSILSDNLARTPAFGPNSVLILPFSAAVKTGTTNDFRDNWTLGYTPDLAVGVWVGNADYTPMNEVSGVTGAAPIWSEFMKVAVPKVSNGQPTNFSRPAGMVEKVICSVSGTEPSEWCPNQRNEFFAADQPPLPKEQDLWQKIQIDTWTGLRASSSCSEFTVEKFAINVTDPWAVKWIKKDPEGKQWADQMGFKKLISFVPDRECKADDPRPTLSISSPTDGETITQNPVDIYGQANATKNFDYIQLEYGLGTDPVKWKIIANSKKPGTDKLFSWDVLEIPSGPITLKLYMHSTQDTYAELRVYWTLQVPTPTPTPTSTPTTTLLPTGTSTVTPIPSSTPTPTPTNTSTPTLTPTSTSSP